LINPTDTSIKITTQKPANGVKLSAIFKSAIFYLNEFFRAILIYLGISPFGNCLHAKTGFYQIFARIGSGE
jgi:hypothetical protein